MLFVGLDIQSTNKTDSVRSCKQPCYRITLRYEGILLLTYNLTRSIPCIQLTLLLLFQLLRASPHSCRLRTWNSLNRRRAGRRHRPLDSGKRTPSREPLPVLVRNTGP